MASLPNCPTELIDSILQHVSFRDLLAVSLVSKRLHECATPLRYSQIDIWTKKLRAGDLNAFVALFLSRLPNLKSFRVENLAVLPDPEKKN
jgi:hypothetical protein